MKSPNLKKKQYIVPNAKEITIKTSVELLMLSEVNIQDSEVYYNEEGL